MNEREALILGALLHDIGKFAQRAKESSEGKDHSTIGAEWLEQWGELDKRIAAYAQWHHSKYFEEIAKSNRTLIVYEADNLSSGERKEKEEGKFEVRHTPLMSIFSRIFPEKKAKDDYFFNEVTFLSKKIEYPKRLEELSIDWRAYNRLLYGNDNLEGFKKEFEFMVKTGITVNSTSRLLEKYTSFIPSETRRIERDLTSYPDISLFDHLKTTAAIANCMYNYFQETKGVEFDNKILKDEVLNRDELRYLFIGGDFSGVQNFIYTITSKGALKTLRARSFFLELLTEHVIESFLESLGLSRASIIFSGGGRFFILSQNTEKTIENLNQILMEINQWLYENHGFDLYLALEWSEACGNDFLLPQEGERERTFDEILDGLSRKLQIAKNRKITAVIKSIADIFFEPRDPKLYNCDVCHKELAKSELVAFTDAEDSPLGCTFCHSLFHFGERLPKAKYLAKIRGKSDLEDSLNILNHSYLACGEKTDIENFKSAERVYVINSWNVEDFTLPKAISISLANYGVKKEERFWEFQELAEEADGINRLGILRMDVDHLGKIFSQGIPENLKSFSRLATLSRNLTVYFKHYLNSVCEGHLGEGIRSLRLSDNHAARKIIVVYSGGDDLFLVGSWSDICELTFDIKNTFEEFTCSNPSITISGGIYIFSDKFPLYKAAEAAEIEEKEAKDKGRNRYSIMNCPLQWEIAEEVIVEILQPILPLLRKDKLSKGFLYKLFAIADRWRREEKLVLPHLAYTIARAETENLKEDENWFRLKNSLMKTLKYMPTLDVSLTWVEFLTRKE